MVQNLKLFWKLALLAALTPAALGLSLLVSLRGTHALKYEYDNLYGFMLVPIIHLDEGNIQREAIEGELWALMRPGLPASERADLLERIRARDTQVKAVLDRYSAEWLSSHSPEFTASLAALGRQELQRQELALLEELTTTYASFASQRDALLRGQEAVPLPALLREVQRMERPMKELVRVNRDFADLSNASAQESLTRMRWSVLGLSLALTLLSLGFAAWLTRLILHPVRDLQQTAQQLLTGEFSWLVRAEESSGPALDEITTLARYFGHFLRELSRVIGEVKTAAVSLASAAEQVSTSAQGLSQGTHAQASAVEETSAQLTQMTASIRQNALHSQQMARLAQQGLQDAEASGQSMTETLGAIQTIAEKVLVIEEIAYRTHLLALNASIVAASAGEHGRTFAVVAGEVRRLAESSRKAAYEVKGIASASVQQAERSGAMMSRLVSSIRQTTPLVQSVAVASGEQSSGVAQISGALGQIERTTQGTAGASEELASTAEELSAQAVHLQQLMAFFQADRELMPRRSAEATAPPSLSKGGTTAFWSPS
jgi:methyl-accepting chemotaxis protein